ncbi:MAG: ubiquinone/menaquinone biosynthesis C-methylase UbiE [Gammaproteobacteria bacterium]|jgi:ubiquinone/menaquinone biosynthesis C-methylase UbiE
MSFYENQILPRIIDPICGHRAFADLRAKIIPQATGRVLEVGYGTGTSLPWYDADKIDQVVALDPASGAMALAAKRERESPIAIEHVALRGEEIPLDAESIDTVVVAYTLCTIPDVVAAIAGMYKVLKPGGKLLFMEHGQSPRPEIRRWQERLNRPWGIAFGGCNLLRHAPQLLEQAGFTIEHREELEVPSPPPIPGMTLVKYNYLGIARRA